MDKKNKVTTVKKDVYIHNAKSKKTKKGGRSKKRNNNNSSPSSLYSKIAKTLDTKVDDYQFAASIVHPWRYRGARIPDSNTTPSGTISSEFQTNISAFALTGGGHGCGICFDVGGLTIGGFLPITILQADAAVGSFKATRSASPTAICAGFANAAAVNSSCLRMRLVSAGLAVRPTTSTALNQGEQFIGQFEDQSTKPVSFTWNDLVSAYRLQRRCPVNPKKACAISYHFGNHVLQEAYFPPTSGGAGIGVDQFGGLIFCARGVDANYSAQVSIVCNWEVIPNSTFSTIVNTQPSHCSFTARQYATNLESTILTLDVDPSDMFGSQPGAVVSSSMKSSANSWNHSVSDVRGFMESASDLLESLSFGANLGMGYFRAGKGLYSALTGGGGQIPPVPQILYGN